MNTPAEPCPQWPSPDASLDTQLDLAGVMASTGCTEEDFVDLADIFIQETGNMTARLDRALAALGSQQGLEGWPAAVEQLRTAAHELTTSFGIVGAKCAEAYSRQTQLRTRKGSALADPPPSPQDLLTAASALRAGVERVAALLRQQLKQP